MMTITCCDVSVGRVKNTIQFNLLILDNKKVLLTSLINVCEEWNKAIEWRINYCIKTFQLFINLLHFSIMSFLWFAVHVLYISF